jgi:hypothetical protein
MKKSTLFEVLAATSAMVGALLLIYTYYPVINPFQYRIDNHRDTAPISRFLIGTPVSILLLSGAWSFNRKTQKLKKDEKDSKPDLKP